MVVQLTADYLVVGAGAAGMAFTDALIDHADVHVVMVDRRHAAGGHWLDAYPFVRLHQASALYGVVSTRLGTGLVQTIGPEAGLHERATGPEICAYYGRVLHERMIDTGKVDFYPGCEYRGGGQFVSLVSGKQYEVRGTPRIVDAQHLSPEIPATTPAPFQVAEGAHVITVNDLVRLPAAPSQFVVAGSGKTATDACLWLLANGVDPGDICWLRPREPWMFNRAVIQPNPLIYLGMAADTMQAAAEASSPDDMFLRLEDAGVMLRIDQTVTPTMAKTPTIAQWEIDRLRTIENVVRLGHVRRFEPGLIVLDQGEVRVAPDAVLVHCAASGLRYRPLVPIWGSDAIRPQPIRTGFPCFGSALTGYVEAILDDDGEKNRLCPPSPFSNTPTDWMRMQVLGLRASSSFSKHDRIKSWANNASLNPARLPAELAGNEELAAIQDRFRRYVGPAVERMTAFAGLS